jgi:hypothetical protein
VSAASFYVALVLPACGGKAGSDDAKPSGGSGNGDSNEVTARALRVDRDLVEVSGRNTKRVDGRTTGPQAYVPC